MNTTRYTRTYIPLLALLLLLALSACDSNDALSDASPRNEITTGTGQAYSVKYSVSSRGVGEVASITYRDAQGVLHTVENPALPWSASYEMHSGDQVSLSAIGTATNGTLLLSMSAVGDHDSVTFNNGCGETPDFPFPLWAPSCNNLNVDEVLP